ncbi:hypothetical protein ACS0TY_014551 [Phlomoides rotata]
MESGGEETGIIPFQEFPSSNFGILDLMDNESNLDQFIDLIQEENARPDPINLSFTSQIFDFDNQNTDGGCLVDSHLFSMECNYLFDFNDDVSMNPVGGISRDCSTENEFPNDIVEEEEREGEEEEEESSATTSEKKQKKSKKIDRSRTLISERQRRGRMKEKLYALRSLVPNITKMDKASIIGDAVLYVQDLQLQAKKLKSEIAGLESSFTGGDNNNKNKLKPKKRIARSLCPNPTIKKIFKMDVFEVEEGGLYVRIVSKKGKGVAVILYKALHTLSTFTIKTSNLVSDALNYVFTFTLRFAEGEDMNLPSLKMRVARAFAGEGFEFETFPSA